MRSQRNDQPWTRFSAIIYYSNSYTRYKYKQTSLAWHARIVSVFLEKYIRESIPAANYSPEKRYPRVSRIQFGGFDGGSIDIERLSRAKSR